MARNEATFVTEFRRSLRTLEGDKFYHKIVDAGFQNPFDSFMVYKGEFYALEMKISKNRVSIPLVDLFRNRQHELDALHRAEDANGTSYILINIFHPHENNFVYFMSVAQYDYLVSSVAPKKSIKLNDPMLNRIGKLKKIKHGLEMVWDLNPLIL